MSKFESTKIYYHEREGVLYKRKSVSKITGHGSFIEITTYDM